MKFGNNLSGNQVPEWSSAYIDYKGLKKLIRVAAEKVRDGEEPDLAAFLYSLERCLEDVDAFYNRKLGDASRRLKLLRDRYADGATSSQRLSPDETNELKAALLELQDHLKKLQWYGEVNRRGFVKIVKKLDKKVPGTHIQPSFSQLKLSPKLFATNQELLRLTQGIEDWLGKLGDVQTTDVEMSVPRSGSSKSVGTENALGLDGDVAKSLQKAMREDDLDAVRQTLSASQVSLDDPTALPSQHLLLSLLQMAISYQARSCMDAFLGSLDGLGRHAEINERNCLHRFVIDSGRSLAHTDGKRYQDINGHPTANSIDYMAPTAVRTTIPGSFKNTACDGVEDVGSDTDRAQLLDYLLGKLRPHQRTALKAKDAYGRLPLHYAAQDGLVGMCRVITRYMRLWDQYDVTEGVDGAFWQDGEGLAPVHLSALANHVLTTRILLNSEPGNIDQDDVTEPLLRGPRSNTVLHLVAKAQSPDVVRLLIEAGVDINRQDDQGETALYVAARFGDEGSVKVLLDGTHVQKADTEVAEHTFDWTPLFVACVEGHLGVVQRLIEAGAQLERPDSFGWTAKEHAALRGHMNIARCLAALTPLVTTQSSSSSNSTSLSPSPMSRSVSDDKRFQPQNQADGQTPSTDPVKTFGHRYLREQALVLVSLGTMDTRKTMQPVTLDLPQGQDEQSPPSLESAISIVVSATGATGEPAVIDLPVQENICTEPVGFRTSDSSKVKLLFDIVPTYRASSGRVLGRAVALLSSIRPTIGSKRSTLQGDISVPIVAADNLEVIGSVHFNFLVITPFHHPNMSITENHTYWKSMTSTTLIGHRGLGKNQSSRKSLQLGENTIESFIAAANLGATYVEFDVQLTKDHVPVIYHDFLVSETGIDAPVHTLTLEQFLHISDQQTPRPSRPSSPVLTLDSSGSGPGVNVPTGRRGRSYSDSSSNSESVDEMRERMKHTRDFKIKGFKGNSRGNFIQAPFTTLEEMFKKLPEHIGFNIEMKYPMLFESEEQGMDTYAVEPNSFVDSVLETVLRLGGKRPIIFSSFNPDICLLLSFKQPSMPVLFLTDAGIDPAGDIRATSLQEAIRFASRWNLLGIVTGVEPLLLCPRLVRVVKESGLVCVSYGTMNNISENVQLQVKEGIDAVIVDSVLAIRQGLTGDAAAGDASAGKSNGTNVTASRNGNPNGNARLEVTSAV